MKMKEELIIWVGMLVLFKPLGIYYLQQQCAMYFMHVSSGFCCIVAVSLCFTCSSSRHSFATTIAYVHTSSGAITFNLRQLSFKIFKMLSETMHCDRREVNQQQQSPVFFDFAFKSNQGRAKGSILL